jgi:hypothetical protein
VLSARPCRRVTCIYWKFYWLAAKIDRVTPEALNKVSQDSESNKPTYKVKFGQFSICLRIPDDVVKIEIIEIDFWLFSCLQ